MISTYFRTDHHFWMNAAAPVTVVVRTFAAAKSASEARAVSLPSALNAVHVKWSDVESYWGPTKSVPGVTQPREPQQHAGNRFIPISQLVTIAIPD